MSMTRLNHPGLERAIAAVKAQSSTGVKLTVHLQPAVATFVLAEAGRIAREYQLTHDAALSAIVLMVCDDLFASLPDSPPPRKKGFVRALGRALMKGVAL